MGNNFLRDVIERLINIHIKIVTRRKRNQHVDDSRERRGHNIFKHQTECRSKNTDKSFINKNTKTKNTAILESKVAKCRTNLLGNLAVGIENSVVHPSEIMVLSEYAYTAKLY